MKLSDIAKMAGVSPSMVSRVLNNNGYVKEEKRQKILKIVEETGFQLNLQAQSLRTKKTNNIVCFIPSFDSRYVSELTDCIVKEFEKQNYTVMVVTYGHFLESPNVFFNLMQRMILKGVDGVILVSLILGDEIINTLTKVTVPIVLIGSKCDFIPCIFNDTYNAGHSLANYALAKGKYKIAYFYSDHLTQFRKGILDTIEASPDPIEVYPILVDLTKRHFDVGVEVAHYLNAMEEVPDIFISEIERIGAVIKANYKKADEVEFIGVGNTEYSKMFNMTTVDYHKQDIAHLACEILCEEIESGIKKPKQYSTQLELIKRG